MAKSTLTSEEVDLTVGMEPVVTDLINELEDDLKKLCDIRVTLKAGQELDETQRAFLDQYIVDIK